MEESTEIRSLSMYSYLGILSACVDDGIIDMSKESPKKVQTKIQEIFFFLLFGGPRKTKV